ncbi:hypothetical protein GCM10023166_25040 [Paeniglutamicibacter cryotolerans]
MALKSRTSYEWALAEQAIWLAGARHLFVENPPCRDVAAAATRNLGETVRRWVFAEESDPGPAPPSPRRAWACCWPPALPQRCSTPRWRPPDIAQAPGRGAAGLYL